MFSRVRTFIWALLLSLAFTGAARAELASFETEHFRFVHAPERPAMAQELAALAEPTFGDVTRQLGVAGTLQIPKIEVRIAHSDEEFVAAMPSGRNIEWAAGVAFPRLAIIVMRISGTTRFEVADVFKHEISHVVLGWATGHADLPHWFMEGVAVHQAGERLAERWQKTAMATLTDSLPPMNTLVDGFPADGTQADFAYAQSTAFVGYLIGRAGWPAIRTLVGKLREGAEFDDAVGSTWGVPIATLEADFRAQVGTSASWLPILFGSTVLTALAGVAFSVLAVRKRRERKERQARMNDPLDDEYA